MPSSYLNDLRIELQATGENANLWGEKLNDALTQIGDALAYGTQDCFATDADATTTVADGAADPARAMYFKVTSSATLTATRVLTIAPNTISRVMFIENATTGSQSITISQGSGANVTIATGKTKVVYLDGAGATAAVVDAMANVDPGVTDTLAEVLVAGNTSGGTGLTMSSGDDLTFTGAAYNVVWDSSDNALEFADNAKAVFGTGSDLQIYHDGTSNIFAGDIVIDGSDASTSIAAPAALSLKAGDANNEYSTLRLATSADGSLAMIGAKATTTGAYPNSVGQLELAVQNGASTNTVLTVNSTGIDITGNATFDDNGKAVFGAGSDLQIYHDGSNSFIKDEGTGDLIIQGTDKVRIRSAAGENMALFNADGSVQLQYDNVTKFVTTSTGIDVTGTVTADGLTVDGDATITGASSPSLTVTDTTNTVNTVLQSFNTTAIVGTTSNHDFLVYANNLPITKFFAGGDVQFYEDTGTTPKLFWDASQENLAIGASSTPSDAKLLLADVQGSTQSLMFSGFGTDKDAAISHNNGDIFFSNGGNNTTVAALTERMRITSAGSVGIGTSSPGYKLQLNSVGDNDGLLIKSGSASYINYLLFGDSGSNTVGRLGYNHANNSMTFFTGDSERMRIDSSGNVGIGTTSPASALELEGVGNATNITLDNTTATTGRSYSIRSGNTGNLDFYDNDATNARVTIDSSGRVGIGTSSPSKKLTVQSSSSGDGIYLPNTNNAYPTASTGYTDIRGTFYDYLTTGQNGGESIIRLGSENANSSLRTSYISFQTSSGGTGTSTERLRIDSSGNLLVGKTSADYTTAGVVAEGDGTISAVKAGTTGVFNRLTSDGDILQFRKDGTTVGSVSVTASATAYNTSSDQRLKDNLVDAPSASDDIDAIQVRSFDWKADGSHQKYGMVAQELVTVAPNAVSQPEDPEEMMGVDYSKLVPMLVKEVQQLRARVAQLEGVN